MKTADRFSVPRGAVRYWVAEGGGGVRWGVSGGGDCFNDDYIRDTMWQMSLTHNDGEIINVCILK